MSKVVLLVSFFLAMELGAVQAQTLKRDFARCVQAQLNELEHNVGRVDGFPGKATLRGYNSLRAEEGFEILPEKFDTHTLIFTCRYLGDKNRELKKFWPAWKRSFTVVTGQGVPDGIITYVQRSIPFVQKRFSAFNMQYSASVNIHIFNDKASGRTFYLDDTVGKNDVATQNFETLYTFHCSNESIGGWSENNNVFICLNYEENDGEIHSDLAAFQKSAFADHQFRFQEVMTSEMFHVSQRELLGAFILEDADITRLEDEKTLEPAWLYEGLAQYFEFRFGGINKQEKDYYAELKNKLKADVSKLRNHEVVSLDMSRLLKAAEIGDVAAFTLQDGRDLKSFYAYFNNRRLGTPWRQAFEEAFGQSVETFYADFAK